MWSYISLRDITLSIENERYHCCMLFHWFQMLSDVRNCILATDLALFFGNKAKLKEIAEKDELSWKDIEHR